MAEGCPTSPHGNPPPAAAFIRQGALGLYFANRLYGVRFMPNNGHSPCACPFFLCVLIWCLFLFGRRPVQCPPCFPKLWQHQ